MKILAIETSCDDTAISLLEAEGSMNDLSFKVLSHTVSSQVHLHKEWGGVVPMLAKREHGKNLLPLLLQVLKESNLLKEKEITQDKKEKVEKILEREPELKEAFLENIFKLEIPEIDLIAVTQGPGLEPALWVGLNFAQALSLVWDKPLVPVNHLEGHIYASLAEELASEKKMESPALALVVSGGHTELVLIKDWLNYEILGKTRDDAAGEAFDKVARILDLPYPGGPQISKLAEMGELKPEYSLPRPMIKSDDYDFSFSGLKTAVLYLVKKIPEMTEVIKASIAREFQNAVVETLVEKTRRAIEEFGPKTVVVGGGVSANKFLKQSFEKMMAHYPETKLIFPESIYSTDNATMIAVAGYLRYLTGETSTDHLAAKGNLTLK